MCKLEQYIVRETTWVLNIFFFFFFFCMASITVKGESSDDFIAKRTNKHKTSKGLCVNHAWKRHDSKHMPARGRACRSRANFHGRHAGHISKGGDKDSYLFWLLRVQLQQIDFRHWEMLSKHHQHSASSQCHQSLGVLGWPLQLSLQRPSWPQ